MESKIVNIDGEDVEIVTKFDNRGYDDCALRINNLDHTVDLTKELNGIKNKLGEDDEQNNRN